jgi:2-keto-3-deoxy-L-rhamnonate aldolase RhmA
VEGVDGLFYGPDDTLLSRGLAMDTPKTPAFVGSDLTIVGEACCRHSKLAATLAFSSELISFCLAADYRLLIVAADISSLSTASSRTSAAARDLVMACVSAK